MTEIKCQLNFCESFLSKYLFTKTLQEEKEILQKIKDPATKDIGFNELVLAYQQRLYWHIRKMVIDHDDTDDLLQEVFIKVWKNIQFYLDQFKSKLNEI